MKGVRNKKDCDCCFTSCMNFRSGLNYLMYNLYPSLCIQKNSASTTDHFHSVLWMTVLIAYLSVTCDWVLSYWIAQKEQLPPVKAVQHTNHRIFLLHVNSSVAWFQVMLQSTPINLLLSCLQLSLVSWHTIT